MSGLTLAASTPANKEDKDSAVAFIGHSFTNLSVMPSFILASFVALGLVLTSQDSPSPEYSQASFFAQVVSTQNGPETYTNYSAGGTLG